MYARMYTWVVAEIVIMAYNGDNTYNNPGPHPKRLAKKYYLDSLALYKYPKSIQCIADVG